MDFLSSRGTRTSGLRSFLLGRVAAWMLLSAALLGRPTLVWAEPSVETKTPKGKLLATGSELAIGDARIPGAPNLLDEAVATPWEALNIINSDRPDYVDALSTAPFGGFLLESGYTYTWSRENSSNEASHALPETLLRLGIHPRIELRFKGSATDFTRRGQDASEHHLGASGAGGTKILLLPQHGWLPGLTFVGEVAFQSHVASYQARGASLQTGVIYGWMLNRWFGFRAGTYFAYAPEYEEKMDEGLLVSQRTYTLAVQQAASLSYQFSKRWGGYTEWYAFFPMQSSAGQHFADAGVFYYLSDALSIDLRYGQSLNGAEERYVGAGFAWRGRFLRRNTTSVDFIPIRHHHAHAAL